MGQAASGEMEVDMVVRSRIRLRHVQGVEAGAAVDHVIVVTSPIDNRVVPGVAADIVVALSAGERVVAVAAGDRIRTAAAVDEVAAGQARDAVVPVTALDPVGPGGRTVATAVDDGGIRNEVVADDRGHRRIDTVRVEQVVLIDDDHPEILPALGRARGKARSEEHTSELPSLMLISYAVFCLKKKQSSTLAV